MARRRRVDYDEPEDVFVDALEHYPSEFLECREGHDWPAKVPFVFVDTDQEDRRPVRGLRSFVERRKICRRCGMVRVEMFAISRTGRGHTSLHKIANGYDPPEGYPIKGTGATRGLNDLLRGVMFDAQQTRARTNGRRRK